MTPASSSPACALQGNVVTCAAGNLDPNQSRTFTIAFGVPTVANCVPSTLTNVASVGGEVVELLQRTRKVEDQRARLDRHVVAVEAASAQVAHRAGRDGALEDFRLGLGERLAARTTAARDEAITAATPASSSAIR